MKIIFLSIFLIFSLCFTVNAQKANSSELKTIKSLQNYYWIQDYERGYNLGKEVSAEFSKNTELQTWFILNTLKADYKKEAVLLAEKLVKNHKDDTWALFALAAAYFQNNQIDKAKPLSEKLLTLSPNNEEIIFLYSLIASDQKEYGKALEFLEQKSSVIKNKLRLSNEKARIYYLQDDKEKSFALFLKSAKTNPNDVNTNYLLGFYLNKNEQFNESLKYLQNAVRLSPNAFSIRKEFWNALWKSKTDINREQRKTEISADIESYAKTQKLSSTVILSIVNKSREFGLADKEKEFSDLLLSKFPGSKETEQMLVNNYRRFNYLDKEGKIDEVKKVEYIRRLKQFIDRPQHLDLSLLGDAYTSLIYVIQSDNNFSDSEFLKLAKQAIQYKTISISEPHSTIVYGLLIRKMFAEAETFSRLGLAKFEAEIEKIKKDGNGDDFIKISEEYDKTKLLNNLGEVLINLKKYDEAEIVLLESAKIDREKNYVFSVFGKLYETQNNYTKAEEFYIDHLIMTSSFNYQNYDNLKNLYQKQNGGLVGYEDYLEKIKQVVLRKRKDVIISQKEDNPLDLAEFNLTSLNSTPVSSNSLRGKVIVINLWATWCGPCIAEFPEFQKLYEKYKDNPNVSILSINFQEDADTIKKFMAEKKYDFSVLMSEKYISQTDTSLFPTTWFVNKNGKKEFIKTGISQRLFEEFDWRIEYLLK